MAEGRVCTECAFCDHNAVGYSAWTIEGEELVCRVNPEWLTVDTSDIAEALALQHTSRAETCPRFWEGTGMRLGLYLGDTSEETESGYRNEVRGWFLSNPGIEKTPEGAALIVDCVVNRMEET